jgi:hypothetical protein
MFSSQNIIYALIPFLIACGPQKVTVCENTSDKCIKYKEIFDSIGLDSEIKELNSKIILLVLDENKDNASKIISYLNKLKETISGSENSSLKNIFIPQKKLFLKNTILNSLQNLDGIFSIECREVLEDLYKERCNVIYLSSILSELRIKEYIESENLPKQVKITLFDVDKDIQKLLSDKNNLLITQDRLIELSPFTFHVPFVEKEVAGVQLILVLGLFLLSGFILGFWVANRNYSKGKIL